MLYLALRHLLSRKKQTTLTLLGIILGATAYVVITGFFLGFRGFLIDQLINNDAHIHVNAKEAPLSDHDLDKAFYDDEFAHVFWRSPPAGRKDYARINNPPDWYLRLNADDRVLAYSPLITTQVILRQAKSGVSATLIGCNAKDQMSVTNIAESMTQGKFSDLGSNGNRIIVGDGLLRKLGARINQTVSVSTGSTEAVPFKIVGVFKTGLMLLDEVRAYSNLANVQRINGTPNQINEIVIRLKDFSNSAEIATNWGSLSVDKVQSWDQINASFFSVFKIQDATRIMMIAVILIVAGFGIYNVLNMTVASKQKEVAILRSMGFDTNDIITLFFSQGLILGLFGGAIGCFLGYWICRYLETVSFGGGPLGGAGYLHIAIEPIFFVQGMSLAVISAALASFLPAYTAGRLTPIEIIRSGGE